ncbi:MAG: type I methionyl aminopeptidase [Patescibacteria group bacterium]
MIIKNSQELEILREGGKLLASILHKVADVTKPGTTTKQIDKLAEDLIRKTGGEPSFKGYSVHGAPMPYPASLCVSINNEIVHGIPSDRILKESDVVGLDIGMQYKGYFTDVAETILVKSKELDSLSQRRVSMNYLEIERLIATTKSALEVGISEVRTGSHVGDIGFVIQRHLEDGGFGVIRELVGHGVGRAVHEDPEIPNWGEKGNGYVLHEGEVIALEPMATVGNHAAKLLSDGWTWATKDGSIAAHFEHTMVVTKNGCEVLTKI